MSKLDTIRLLIIKAARDDTPIDEARACALQAAKLIVKYEFKVVDIKDIKKTIDEKTYYDDYEVPDMDASQFIDVEPFRLEVAKYNMTCVKCKKEIIKGMPIAVETNANTNPKVTHYDCRRFFVGK